MKKIVEVFGDLFIAAFCVSFLALTVALLIVPDQHLKQVLGFGDGEKIVKIERKSKCLAR